MSETSPSSLAATMPAPEGDQHCHLLDLPVEMLQRITNQLHRTQALPALRLACKALDNITFDRFAQTFKFVRCCIFYEQRWLSLKRLLEKPSRITSRIRWVEFTTCLFEDKDFSKVPLALNHDDGVLATALYKNHKAYVESQAAEIQGPINVALFGRVLSDLKRVFPHIEIGYRISENQGEGFEHMRAQRDILPTMLITDHKIRHLALSHGSVLTMDNFMDHMRPELLQSVSNLRGFTFASPRDGETNVTQRNATAYDLRVRVMHKVLESAGNLRSLELCLYKFTLSNRASDIARTALHSTVSNKIQRFLISNVRVDEVCLLKALSRWAPKLVELELRDVVLIGMREGWLPILQLIATMPKLKNLTLWEMAEKRPRRPGFDKGIAMMDMNHLAQGRKSLQPARMLTDVQQTDAWGRQYSGRIEVVSGLDELLAGRLSYQAF